MTARPKQAPLSSDWTQGSAELHQGHGSWPAPLTRAGARGSSHCRCRGAPGHGSWPAPLTWAGPQGPSRWRRRGAPSHSSCQPRSPGQAPEVHLAADVGAWTQDHPQPHLCRQQNEGPGGSGSPTLRTHMALCPLPSPAWPSPGGLGTRPPQSRDALPPHRVTAEPATWDVGPATLGRGHRAGLGGVGGGAGPAQGWQGHDEGHGAGTGSPPAAPSAWTPHGSPPLRPPRPRPAGSQNLLQVQVLGEVECASLRLVEVPRDVAVAGKRVTGVRPPVVLHSVSQSSTSVPKTLVTAEG